MVLTSDSHYDTGSILALYKPFENIYHGMDMWHKAKSLNKKLHKAAAVNGQEELHQWIDAMVNHFWFCCQECNGNVSELKVQGIH